MQTIWMVICNAGDGSNFIQWVDDEKVIDRIQEVAENGEELYASGDGLQTNEIYFNTINDVVTFSVLNRIRFTTLKDLEHY